MIDIALGVPELEIAKAKRWSEFDDAGSDLEDEDDAENRDADAEYVKLPLYSKDNQSIVFLKGYMRS